MALRSLRVGDGVDSLRDDEDDPAGTNSYFALMLVLEALAIGVFAQVMYASYDAFLRGSRRVALVAKISVLANLMATAIGIALVYVFGAEGIVWAMIAQPVLTLIVAAIAGRDLTTHLGTADRARTRGRRVRPRARP